MSTKKDSTFQKLIDHASAPPAKDGTAEPLILPGGAVDEDGPSAADVVNQLADEVEAEISALPTDEQTGQANPLPSPAPEPRTPSMAEPPGMPAGRKDKSKAISPYQRQIGFKFGGELETLFDAIEDAGLETLKRKIVPGTVALAAHMLLLKANVTAQQIVEAGETSLEEHIFLTALRHLGLDPEKTITLNIETGTRSVRIDTPPELIQPIIDTYRFVKRNSGRNLEDPVYLRAALMLFFSVKPDPKKLAQALVGVKRKEYPEAIAKHWLQVACAKEEE